MFRTKGVSVIFADDDTQVQIQETTFPSVYFLHCDIYNWTPAVNAKLAVVVQQLSREMLKLGIFSVYAVYEKDDTKGVKFASSYGFQPQCYLTNAVDGNEYVLMNLDCEREVA